MVHDHLSSAETTYPTSNYDVRLHCKIFLILNDCATETWITLYVLFRSPLAWMYALSSKPYHIVLWILLTVGIVGNVLVVLWRCTRNRGQRTSTVSLLIVMLAIADFLYCVHLLILEVYVVDDVFRNGTKERIYKRHSASIVCTISGALSLFSCSTALWMTVNIAISSVQLLRNPIKHWFCGRKTCLFTTVFSQWTLTTIPLTVAICVVLYNKGSLLNFGDHFNPLTRRHVRGLDNKVVDITAVFSSCALAQSNGQSLMANWSHHYVINNTNSTYRVTTLYCRYDQRLTVNQYNGVASILGGLLVSFNSVLTISCTVLYLYLCRFLWSSKSLQDASVHSDSRKLMWRLSVIILLNTICWIPATTMH